MRRVPEHPLAPQSGIVAECRLVLYEKIGPGPQSCQWCGKHVWWKPGRRDDPDALVADHLDWDNQNNDPDNLVPSCRVCNAHRIKGGGRAPIRPDELFVVASNGVRHRAVWRTCQNCGEGFLARLAFVKRGGAIFCSASCIGRDETGAFTRTTSSRSS